ncbi:S-layer protein [Candidatus Woesearchaeota archaeon]|jgi:hypothetical protein|nr:S-layer protein [Candidatus Woesearchaeota archaeon]MBT4387967.1 S-layer protein [Candidatus Woesearchaeota archaeon]MBT4595311.1 S-layer protein [Candidatus Woesearchaeota archaeon]MBT6505633.1 S-layer protein [Candidatus Woesearchaeota archaeon]MBT7849161.1 S-layer protein [Candidatus Woesearchaeota archaeon]
MKNVMTKIKKFATAGASIALLGTSMVSGAAAASFADYPAPFVKDGKYDANAFIVMGANAATMDVIGALDVAASLQAVSVVESTVQVSSTCGGVTGLSVLGDAAKFEVSNDILAYGESIGDVRSQFIGKIGGVGDLLAFSNAGKGPNEVNGNQYSEYLYFEDKESGTDTLASTSVSFTKADGDDFFAHNDESIVDSYLVFNKGGTTINQSLFEYEMDFSSDNNWEIQLPSDSYTYAGDSLSILGTDFHVVRGALDSTDTQLTLEFLGTLPDEGSMVIYETDPIEAAAFATELDLPNNRVTEPFMVGIYNVVVELRAATAGADARFNVRYTNTVTGEEKYESNIKVIEEGAVEEVGDEEELFMYVETINSLGDNTDEIHFLIGSDHIKLVDNFTDDTFVADVTVDGEKLNNGFVRMKGSYDSSAEELALRTIEYRLNDLDEDVYVPSGHGLREYLSDDCDIESLTCESDSDYQYFNGMLGQNWDIKFLGMTDAARSNITLSGSSGNLDLSIVEQGSGGKASKLQIINYDKNEPMAWRTDDGDIGTRYDGDFEAFIFTEGWYNTTNGNITNSNGTTPCTGANHETCQLIYDEDVFVVSHKATRDDDVRSHILEYSSIDTNNNKIKFNSVAQGVGDIERSYALVAGNDNVLGEAKLNARGDEYQFYVLDNETLNYPIVVDLNKDGVIDNSVSLLANEFGVVMEFEKQATPPYLTASSDSETVNFNLSYVDDMFEDRSSDLLVQIPITLVNSSAETMSVGTVTDNDGSGTNILQTQKNAEDTQFGADIYGTTFMAVESGDGDDETITMSTPSTQLSAQVFVVFGDSEVSSGGSSGSGEAVTQSVNRARLGMGVLDSEASRYVDADGSFSKNMIVIGGPCANSVAAALEGKSADACGEGYEPGQSFLKMVESGENVAVLAFGYDAAGTLKATDKLSGLASSDNANLGTEVPLN